MLRALLTLALTGCGVVLVDTDDAGWHPDAAPFPDAGDPNDGGDPNDAGDAIDAGEDDASPQDADLGLPDSGVTHTLTISVVGPGRVTSDPSGIDCDSICSVPFSSGSAIQLSALSDPNARVAGWSVPCTSALDHCTVTLVQDLGITIEFEVRPPIVTTGQAADLVLGQPDFTTTALQTSPTGATLNFPLQCSAFGSRLWIADAGNNRLLQWDNEPFLPQTSAAEAVGQPNLLSNGTVVDEEGFSAVLDAASDGQRLFVVGDRRILIFDPIPNNSGRSASLVIGQLDFMTSDLGPASATQFGPSGISIAGGRLFLADITYNRVLIWNSIPTTSGLHDADVVLGQPDFTTTTVVTPPTASSLKGPRDVFFDENAGRLLVVDTGNHRVLIWNSLPSVNGAPADIVVGQNDFAGRLSNAGATDPNQFGFLDPRAATIAHDALFVADFGNQRVLVWQPVPQSSTTPATFVLGRSSFSETGNPAPSATTVGYAHGICVLNDSVYVVSSSWHRATRFEVRR